MFVAQSSWHGYGTGAYAFQSPTYFTLFNDPYDGSSKPNIHVNPTFAPNERISLVEFSDWTSYVDGYNLFNDFNGTIRVSSEDGYNLFNDLNGTMRVSSEVLNVTYSRPGLVVHKFIGLSSAGYVVVKLQANKEIVAHIEMWKWLMTSVNGVTVREGMKPRLLPISRSINFTFKDQLLLMVGSGSIELSRLPTKIEVWPFQNGFNRVTVDYVNSQMEFIVSGSVAAAQQTFFWSYADLPYVLPLVAVAVVSLYLLVERYGTKNKGYTRRSSR